MKIKNNLIQAFILLGVILILSNSCKKKESDNPEPVLEQPVLTTGQVINILQNTAICGGNITSDGGSEISARGVCWNISENPTITNNKSDDGIGIGRFTSNIENLTENTTYYVRAYATNAEGTVYGNETTFKTPKTGDIADADWNYYNVLTIGTQTWMAENLKTTKYANGDLISTTDPATLSVFNDIEPKFQWVNGGDINNAKTFGRVYTWHAIMDSRGICPVGWHVPTDNEWKTLEMFLGMSQADANKSSDVRGTNEGSKLAGNSQLWSDGILENDPDFAKSGFNALPGGNRYGIGNFSPVGGIGTWWTSSSETATGSWYREINSNESYIRRGLFHVTSAHSVRCVKD